MDWLAALTLVLKVVVGVADFLSRRQLLEAGKAEIITQGLRQTLDNVQKAKNVTENLTSNPTGAFANKLRDKYTRTDDE